MHTYYIKKGVVWNTYAKQASWLTQKDLSAAKYLPEANIRVEDILNAGSYSIRDIYNKLRGDFPEVEWRKLLCNNQSSPKWIFILYIALQGRLYTRDKLIKWGILTSPFCSLCEGGAEDHEHLFFKCNYSTATWRKLLYWIGINRDAQGWTEKSAGLQNMHQEDNH